LGLHLDSVPEDCKKPNKDSKASLSKILASPFDTFETNQDLDPFDVAPPGQGCRENLLYCEYGPYTIGLHNDTRGVTKCSLCLNGFEFQNGIAVCQTIVKVQQRFRLFHVPPK
jgi:hypothetical protein